MNSPNRARLSIVEEVGMYVGATLSDIGDELAHIPMPEHTRATILRSFAGDVANLLTMDEANPAFVKCANVVICKYTNIVSHMMMAARA